MPQPEQQPEPGQGTKKRKRLWIVGGIAAAIVVAVVVVAVIVAATVIDGSTGGQGTAARADGAPAPAGDDMMTVTYEVSGDADRAGNVTYSADENLNLSQRNGVALPWTTDIAFPGTFPAATLALTAQSGAEGPGEITCRILRDGEVLSESTSRGPYAVVTCSGS